MRPVNLIPPEDRRGDRAPSRTGALPHAVVGVLAAALIGVTAVVFTGNQVSDREVELAGLETREAAASARAEALRPYADFAALATAREATVTSLAQSRFDWERVLRELALVMPSDVWLVGLTASAGAASGAATAASGIAGPSLELSGCGASHESVAAFVAVLEDIDGVTRVGISSSERPDASATGAGATAAAGGSEAGGDCRTRDFIAKFEIVVAFDGVPAPVAATVPIAPTAPAPVAPSDLPAEAPPVADAPAQQQQDGDSTPRQDDTGASAAATIPGVAR